eukprot:Em0002g1262a
MNSVMTEQIEIQLYNDIYRYFKDSEYRPNATKNDKRAIRRRACSFVLRDGLLYFTEDGADSTAKQWIVDKESQMKAVGILDATRLFRKSVRRDMTKHIKEYVNTFEQCQKANPKMIKETAVLHPISVKTEVWHQIGIDLVGPLKLTRRGNSKQVRQDAKLLDTTNSVFKDQLYSSHLLRLWRTGAANFSYSADEDDFDPSSLHFNEGKATVHSESDKLTSGHLLDREKREVIFQLEE